MILAFSAQQILDIRTTWAVFGIMTQQFTSETHKIAVPYEFEIIRLKI
jgi:hypothetical protein